MGTMIKKDGWLYARFDVNMDEHPKVAGLSDAAFRALIESTFYARRQLTDGFLDARVVARRWGAETAAELCANDPERPSWEKVDAGYQIHDYSDHQTTSADIEVKRTAGRLGGLAKASNALAPASKVLQQKPSTILAITETETETETETKEGSAVAEPRRSRAVTLPARFEVTQRMTSWAQTKAPGIDLEAETEKFKNFHLSKGSTFKSWEAAWRTWITKAVEFRAKDAVSTGKLKEWWL